MQSPQLYHLTFLILSAYVFVVKSSGPSLQTSMEKPTLSISIEHNNVSPNTHEDEAEKARVDVIEHVQKARTVHKEGDINNTFHSFLQFTGSIRHQPRDRIRRSAEYENNEDGNILYQHQVTDAENITWSGENGADKKRAQNVSKEIPNNDRNRPRKRMSLHRHTTSQGSTDSEVSTGVTAVPKLDVEDNDDREDENNSESDTADDGSNYVGTNAGMEDLFRKFSKRINRPSWFIQFLENATTDSSQHKHYEVTENSDNTSGSANVTVLRHNTLSDNENSSTTLFQDMMVTSLLSDPNSSDISESFLENTDNETSLITRSYMVGNNMSLFHVSPSMPSTPLVRTDKIQLQDEGEHFDTRKHRHKSEHNGTENAESKDVGESMKAESGQNELREVTNDTGNTVSDDLLKLPEFSRLDSKTVGNLSRSEVLGVRELENGDSVDEERNNGKLPKNVTECPMCTQNDLTEEYVKLMRLNMFRNLLTQKLRLDRSDLFRKASKSERQTEDRIPKIPHSIVEQMFKDNAREIEVDEFHARDQELIIAGEDMGRDCIKLHATGCYSFSLKGRIRGEVAEAQLWLYKMKDTNDITGQTFNLYELERVKSGRLAHSSMIASIDTFTQEDWIVMNVTRSLLKWVSKRKGTEMLAVRCATCATRSHRNLYGAKDGYKPLLIIKYATNSHLMRNKRSERCDPRYECCKRDLVVNFHDIGMYDIIQPRNLSVGYCFGGCNEIDKYIYNHTVIKQRWSQSLTNQDSMKQQLKPCCAPLILKDIFIITSDGSGAIVQKRLPKVIVETCGCM